MIKLPPKTGAQRAAALKAARKAAGLVRLELWLHPVDHEAIKAYVAKLAEQRAKPNTAG